MAVSPPVVFENAVEPEMLLLELDEMAMPVPELEVPAESVMMLLEPKPMAMPVLELEVPVELVIVLKLEPE